MAMERRTLTLCFFLCTGVAYRYACLGHHLLRRAARRVRAPERLHLRHDRPGRTCSFCPLYLFLASHTPQITLNLLAQIIPGTLLPGKPLANLVFKAYSVQTLTEATSFVQDLKLGHYIKISPRATFKGASLALPYTSGRY